MNWDAIGAVGEIVGASFVLVTLIYLSIQIRNNTNEVQTENVHRVTDSFNELNMLVAANESLTELWCRGMADYDDLSDTEKARFGFMWLSAFRIYDSLYYQIKRGTGDKELWIAELDTLKWLFSSPGTRAWWRQQQFALSPGFRDYIKKNVYEANEADA